MWRRFAMIGTTVSALGGAYWYQSDAGPANQHKERVPHEPPQRIHHNPRFFTGAYAIQGRREYMEDRYIINDSVAGLLKDPDSESGTRKGLSGAQYLSSVLSGVVKKAEEKQLGKLPAKELLDRSSVFGVFDGHGGRTTSSFAAAFFPYVYTEGVLKALSEAVDKAEEKPKDWNALVGYPQVISDALHETHARLMKSEYAKRKSPQDGSTAIVCLFTDGTVVTANVGDSRAVLGTTKGAIDLSIDHKPDDPKELKRIVAAGGAVELDRYGTPRIYYKDTARGGLALSRALGDDFYKPHGRAALVPVDPDVTVHPLQPDRDEFVIIASDGLWDVYSSQQAVQLVSKVLKSESVQSAPHDQRAQMVSKFLVDSAFNAGSTDNITAIIVLLDFSKVHQSSL
mmetsp:Transcript_12391/g.49660  ORF Transcript_12391/g.49660 Transcript_12391/m.49660 type:complete len:398 (+) Transcript_12391:65-1258(+)